MILKQEILNQKLQGLVYFRRTTNCMINYRILYQIFSIEVNGTFATTMHKSPTQNFDLSFLQEYLLIDATER